MRPGACGTAMVILRYDPDPEDGMSWPVSGKRTHQPYSSGDWGSRPKNWGCHLREHAQRDKERHPRCLIFSPQSSFPSWVNGSPGPLTSRTSGNGRTPSVMGVPGSWSAGNTSSAGGREAAGRRATVPGPGGWLGSRQAPPRCDCCRAVADRSAQRCARLETREGDERANAAGRHGPVAENRHHLAPSAQRGQHGIPPSIP
jgi:hypothetical protein